MLKIRLNRIGKKKKAYYKIVVSERTKTPSAKYLELLGSYDPHAKNLQVDADRIKYWIGKGAQPSATLHNMFITRGILQGEKVQSWKPKKGKEGAKSTEATPPAPPAAV